MKNNLFLFFLYVCVSLPVSAQQFKRIFLFDDFVRARILFHNRSVSVLPINYDASNKVMFFRQGEDMMEMTNPAQVDTICFEERKFVPVGKGFHEVVFLKKGVVYIDWLLKDVNIGSKGALGAVTQGSVKTLQMSDLGLNGTEMYTPYQTRKTGNMDVYRRKNDNTYYIKIKGKPEKVKSLKHLGKLFTAYKKEIERFAKEREIDMKDTRDALVILDYCMGLGG